MKRPDPLVPGPTDEGRRDAHHLVDRFLVRRYGTQGTRRMASGARASLARETHINDPLPPQGLKLQIGFSCSDGFGREIQKKIQAEPGPWWMERNVRRPDGWAAGGPSSTIKANRSANMSRSSARLTNSSLPEPPASAPSCSRPRRSCRRDSAPESHLGKGSVRSLAAGSLGCQRYRAGDLTPSPIRTSAPTSAAFRTPTICRPGIPQRESGALGPQEQRLPPKRPSMRPVSPSLTPIHWAHLPHHRPQQVQVQRRTSGRRAGGGVLQHPCHS